MRNLILIILFTLASSASLSAQNSFDELVKEMEQIQQELFKELEQMDLSDQDFQFFSDTIVHHFGDLDMNSLFQEELDPALLEGMFKQMEEQLSQMDQQDWSELEHLFKSLEQAFPIKPSSPNQSPQDQPVKKKEKKRKTYRM